MYEIVRYGTTKRWSDAVVVGGMAYFVEVPDTPDISYLTNWNRVHLRWGQDVQIY